MSAQAEFRAALEDGDVRLLMKASAVLFPHLPQPATVQDAETSMHMARTQADWLDLKRRGWSHRWLTERGLPSQLPDVLRPKAERLYPVVVEAVLVSANTSSPALRPVAQLVQRAMCDAVEEAAADGKLGDSEFVRARMFDARAKTFKQLLGTTGRI